MTFDLGGATVTTDTAIATSVADETSWVQLIIQNGKLVGGSPALVVDSGNVELNNMTASTSTDAPTIVVNGGSLVVRNSTIDQSSSYDQPAIQINGGSVDLGTPTDPGGNRIDADGTSEPIQNNTDNAASIAGDWLTVNGVSAPIDITVTSTADSGLGSLPNAILEANSNPGSAGSVIDFDPTVFAMPQTITLSSTLELNESAGPEVLRGPGAKLLTVSGNDLVGVFDVDSGTTASLVGLSVSGGFAENGGGIDNSGTLTVADDIIGSNFAVSKGAGIDNSGSLTMTGCSVGSNSVGFLGIDAAGSGSGGGLYNSGAMRINSSTITGNSAGNGGGGIYVGSGALTIANSTIESNQIQDGYGNGAGIYNSGALTIINATIAYNESNLRLPADSDVGGAGVYEATGGSATLDNTIVASNQDIGYLSTFALPADIGGAPLSSASAYNLIGSVASGGLVNGSSGNIVGVNPGLGSLADNGGATRTIALMPGSPAIDAGSVALALDPVTGLPLTTDQRGVGFPRIDDGSIDIGAFERPDVTMVPTIYTVDLTSDTGTSTGPYQGDLRYCINQANANTNLAGSVITFDPADFNASTPETITLTDSMGSITLADPSGPEVIEGPGPNILTISGSVSVPQAISVAGGVTATLCALTISDCAYGGVAIDPYATVAVDSCDVVNNPGGGIQNGGWLTVNNSTLTGNVAYGGGGIYNGATGTLALVDSTIADNTATAPAFFVYEPSGGGGVDNAGSLTVLNSTIANNQAVNPAGGGGLYDEADSTVALYNSIVALNSDSGGADDIAGSVLSPASEYNLVGVDETGSLTNGVDGNEVGVNNPELGPLADNGGPTETISLLGGSPAIDAGSNFLALDPDGNPLATDQRGFARVVNGAADIGAFEAQQEATATTVEASPSTSVSGQSVTFTATVTPQGGSAIPTATGSIQFEVDGSNFDSPVGLVDGLRHQRRDQRAVGRGPHDFRGLYAQRRRLHLQHGDDCPHGRDRERAKYPGRRR